MRTYCVSPNCARVNGVAFDCSRHSHVYSLYNICTVSMCVHSVCKLPPSALTMPSLCARARLLRTPANSQGGRAAGPFTMATRQGLHLKGGSPAFGATVSLANRCRPLLAALQPVPSETVSQPLFQRPVTTFATSLETLLEPLKRIPELDLSPSSSMSWRSIEVYILGFPGHPPYCFAIPHDGVQPLVPGAQTHITTEVGWSGGQTGFPLVLYYMLPYHSWGRLSESLALSTGGHP